MTLIPHNKGTERSFISYEYSNLHGLFANHGRWAFNLSNICKTLKAMQPLTWVTETAPSCDFFLFTQPVSYICSYVHALWSMQTGYDLWHSDTCVPCFSCERNKWQAWRLRPDPFFSLSISFCFFFLPLVQVFSQISWRNCSCFKLERLPSIFTKLSAYVTPNDQLYFAQRSFKKSVVQSSLISLGIQYETWHC